MIALDALGCNFLLTLTLPACFCMALYRKVYSECDYSWKLAGKCRRMVFAMARGQEVNSYLEF